jgi:hypothetical protein
MYRSLNARGQVNVWSQIQQWNCWYTDRLPTVKILPFKSSDYVIYLPRQDWFVFRFLVLQDRLDELNNIYRTAHFTLREAAWPASRRCRSFLELSYSMKRWIFTNWRKWAKFGKRCVKQVVCVLDDVAKVTCHNCICLLWHMYHPSLNHSTWHTPQRSSTSIGAGSLSITFYALSPYCPI